MSSTFRQSNRPRISSMTAAWCAGILLAAFAGAAGADTIALRQRAQATGPELHLKDVAELEGDAAVAMGDTVIATLTPTMDQLRLTIGAVRQTLTDHKANWARLSLRGFAECVVERVSPAKAVETKENLKAADDGEVPASPAVGPAAANPTSDISIDSPLTIGGSVVDILRRLAGGDPNDLTITFADRDKETVNLSIGGDRIEMDPMSRAPLGRVPVLVRRYRQGQQIATYHLTADVVRRALVVVAARPITRGQTIGRDDVAVQQVELRTDLGEPLSNLTDVVGQRALMMLRKDTVVDRGHLGSPILVERGELVTIHCVSGGLTVKTVGRAVEAGGAGDTIEVRNERSRKSFSVRVTGRQMATLNLDAASETTSPEAPAAARSEAGAIHDELKFKE